MVDERVSVADLVNGLGGAARLRLNRGYSAHSMRSTFITTALEHGAQLEDVQKATGHRAPSTTKLYDRRGYNPRERRKFFCDVLGEEVSD